MEKKRTKFKKVTLPNGKVRYVGKYLGKEIDYEELSTFIWLMGKLPYRRRRRKRRWS